MAQQIPYPVIDVRRTGENIRYLRERQGLTVNDVRKFFGFSDPQAIYQWQRGVNLPSVDHLCALSKLLGVSMDSILVLKAPVLGNNPAGMEAETAAKRKYFAAVSYYPA